MDNCLNVVMMVSIEVKKVSGKDYYYLRYSYREGGKVKLIEKGIGTDIPANLENLKLDFIKEITQKRWIDSIENITNKNRERFNSLPSPIQMKDLRTFGIKFTYHSNKIEGSSLTHKEVALIIEEPKVPINKSPYDVIEAKLHMEIYEMVIESNSHKELTMDMINGWHKTLFSLHPIANKFAGLIREEQVYISGSDHVPPLDPKPLLIELFNWYNENKDSMHPVLLACLMHFRFVKIHPYLDGNGRMCRLVQNFILFKNNYPMYALPYRIRRSYYKAIEKSVLNQDEMFFVGWFFRNYLKNIQNI
jgi:Fic family protein